MKGFKVFTAFLVILALSACSTSPQDMTEVDGFSVGYKKIKVKVDATKEKFPMALIYPSSSPSKQVKYGPFRMKLSIGGKVADGKFPLVIISHGSGGIDVGYRSIAFELVKQGYIVGVPLHPKNNFKNNKAEGSIANWRNRPKHISAAIDAIVSYKKVSPNVDVEKVAVVGHSSGGYTALAAAGGIADTTHIIDLCLSEPQLNKSFCDLLKKHKTEKTKIENVQDQRIKAVVLMAPIGILFDSENSLDKVDIPAFLIRAEKDYELIEPYHSDVIVKNYKNRELLTYCMVENAGHYSFMTPFPESIESEVGVVSEDPEGFDRAAFHEVLSADIVNFLNGALYDDHKEKFQPTSCING